MGMQRNKSQWNYNSTQNKTSITTGQEAKIGKGKKKRKKKRKKVTSGFCRMTK